jgi:hypothetical protein
MNSVYDAKHYGCGFACAPFVYLIAVKPLYNVSLGTKILQRYIEINVISSVKYMGVYGEGEIFLDVISRENVISRYVISGFTGYL